MKTKEFVNNQNQNKPIYIYTYVNRIEQKSNQIESEIPKKVLCTGCKIALFLGMYHIFINKVFKKSSEEN